MLPNYWWVNHKQTVKQEIKGGYLWSPKKNKNGTRNNFYQNMLKACPGDFVFSYANAKIGYFGVVTGLPSNSSKPHDFKNTGESWSDDGWKVAVSWKPLKLPFRPKAYIKQLRPLLPDKYAPIRKNGDGNQGAYLCQISKSLFEELKQIGKFDPEEHETEQKKFDEEQIINNREDLIQAEIEADPTLDQTTKKQVVLARRGQGTFRRNVEKLELCCRITGLKNHNILIASHIKPWAKCDTPAERLDGSNGFLLAPNADSLFDKGYITFECDGQIKVSRDLDRNSIECLGLADTLVGNVGAFSKEQETYLKFHRIHVFKNSDF